MRSSSLSSFAKVILICCLTILATSSAFANVSGAIFTTTSTGTKVNGNLYASKADVYLNGGPQNKQDPGLVPDGIYYFQVTDPSGATLLSLDDITCRQVVVSGGRIVGVPSGSAPSSCIDGYHNVGTTDINNGQTPVQLCNPVLSKCPTDFADTPNPGGEYKAWLTPVEKYVGEGPNTLCSTGRNVHGFCDSESKTDNFKVQLSQPPPCDPATDPQQCKNPPPPSAKLVACKYWDKDDDGFNEGPDVLLSGWTITATADASNVDVLTITNGSSTGSSASGVTDDTGCTTFTVIGFADGTTHDSVTLNETLQPGWSQVAPLTGTYNGGTGGDIAVTGNCTANQQTGLVAPCTSTSDVPLIGDGSTTVAPDFGNTGVDLLVSKTAVPTFTRTYSWTIQKTNDKTSPIEQSGGNVTVHYTVTTGFTVADSAYAVSGKITVKNPNIFAVTADVTDAVDDGGSCTVTNGTGVTVPAANYTDPQNPVLGSKVLDYSCSYSVAPNPLTGGTNTATATWDNTVYFTPNSAASGTAGVDFSTPTTVLGNPQNVYDTFNGGSQVLLGVDDATTANICTANTNAATDGGLAITCTAGVFKYARTISVIPGVCRQYDNTAAIADQTSSSSVTICGTNTGALTMGFWQNKNGQGIITSYCGGVSGTSLHSFLNAYNPFKDETSATCSGEASYVLGVIKAATCTSSTKTCNSMLKAQMLATALDVYFSDSTLGGKKIGAFNGLGNNTPALGGVGIDLSKVCAMVDGSSSSTCSGAYEDARPEFGIANTTACKGATVSTMLAYSNFASGVNGNPVSNVGGTAWYLQIKGRQVFAKDAFDSTNNQVSALTNSTCSSSF